MQSHENDILGTAGDRLAPDREEQVIPLHIEDIAVSRRKVETAVVRVQRVTHSRDQEIDEQVGRERVDIERVPIGRYVETMPEVREEGDITIMPIVEEVIVIERKLLLREEVHIRRVHTTERHVETVQVREQEAVITRIPAGKPDAPVSFVLPTT